MIPQSRRLVWMIFISLMLANLSGLFAQDVPIPVPATEIVISTLPPAESATEIPSITPLPTEAETPLPIFTETLLPSETPTILPISTASETSTETPAASTDIETPTLQPSEALTPEVTADVSLSPSPSPTGTGTATATAIETPTLTQTANALPIETIISPTDIVDEIKTITAFENFDQGDFRAWYQPLYPVDTLATTSDSGRSIHISPETHGNLSFGEGNIGDVIVQARFLINAGVAKFAVNHSQAGEYQAWIGVDGQVALYRRDILLATAVIAPSSTWHLLKLGAVGGNVTVTVDDVQLISITDANPLPDGMVWVAGDPALESDFLFDDFSLAGLQYPPPILTPVETPFQNRASSLMTTNNVTINNTAGKIAFYSDRSGNPDVWVMNADGSNPVNLTNNPASDGLPSWSNDGTQIIFLSTRNGNVEVFTMLADGTNVQQITATTGSENRPTFAPNGARVAYERGGIIYVKTLSTGIESQITSGIRVSSNPDWTPHGNYLVYQDDRAPAPSSSYNIQIVDSTGLWIRSLSTNGGIYPSWSPGLTDVVYLDEGLPGLAVTSNTGVFQRRLTTNFGSRPTWSPDASKIAFENLLDGEIYSIFSSATNGNASGLTNLTNHTAFDALPDWNPGSGNVIGTPTFTPIPPTITLTPSLTYTPTPDTNNIIFQDNFENGNLLAWLSRYEDNGRLSASNASKFAGQYGMQAFINSNTGLYVEDYHPAYEPRYRARFYFDPNSITMANNDAHYIFEARRDASALVLYMEFRMSSGSYQLRMQTTDDAGNFINTNWFSISDAYHYVEFDWRAATAAGANNGSLTFWIDGVQQANLTTLDNDTRRIENAFLGPRQNIDTGTRGTLYFDEFVSARYNYIGPVSSGTPTPTTTPTPYPCPCSLWTTSTTPAYIDVLDASPIELGVRFQSSVPARVTGMRFHKGPLNTGTHTGHLWTTGGTLLASATFTGETASGWQTVTFSSPVAISANTDYIASYHSPTGYFSVNTNNYFTSAWVNAPLTAPAHITGSPNGIFTRGASGTFPNTGQNFNYWVDVVILPNIATATPTATRTPTATLSPTPTPTPTPNPCPCSLWTTSDTPTGLDSGNNAPVEVGVKFRSAVTGNITGLRFYKGTANTGTHTGHLWTSSGTLLATATFTGETASGWQTVTLSSPVAISANTIYVASYHTTSGRFSYDTNYFVTSRVRGPLTAPDNASSGGNGVYAAGVSGTFPTIANSSTNFWVDVIFSPNSVPTATPTGGFCPQGFAAQSGGVSPLNDPEDPCVQITPTPTFTPTICYVSLIPQTVVQGYKNSTPNQTRELEDMQILSKDTNGNMTGLKLSSAPVINAQLLPYPPIQWGAGPYQVSSRIEFTQGANDKQIWYQVGTPGNVWIPVRYDGLDYSTTNDPCSTVGAPSMLTLTYDRVRAANYAIEHSYDTAVNHSFLQNTEHRVTQALVRTPPLPYAYFRYSGLGTINPNNGQLITGSATFVSESQWVGGMPMTLGNVNSCATGTSLTDAGWRYCFNVPGTPPLGTSTDPWDTHGDLHTYWTGSSITPVLPPASPRGGIFGIQGGQFNFVIVGRATIANDGSNGLPATRQTDLNPLGQTLINLGQGTVSVPNRSALSTRVVSLMNQNQNSQQPPQRLKMGDYITMLRPVNNDSTQPPGSIPFHGLMVIGWQEALDCQEAIFQGNNYQNPFRIWTVDQFAETHIPGNPTIALDGTTIANPVPWVVDFTSPPVYNNGNVETQNPVPRPFYCTMYFDFQQGLANQQTVGVDRFFAHDWQFFTLPDQVALSPNQVYVDPVWGW